jgi:gas vesicle protein
MNVDSRKVLRIARAILSGDINLETPQSKSSSGIPLFLAGLGTGVALGMLFAPASGEETRMHIAERAKEGVETAKSKGQEFSRKAQNVVNRGKEQASEAADTAREAYYNERKSSAS